MKTITSLVAATALIAGVTVAAAQMRPSEQTPAGADSTQHTQGAPQPNTAPRTANPPAMGPATTGQSRMGPGTPKPSEQRPVGTDSPERAAGAPQPMDSRMRHQ